MLSAVGPNSDSALEPRRDHPDDGGWGCRPCRISTLPGDVLFPLIAEIEQVDLGLGNRLQHAKGLRFGFFQIENLAVIAKTAIPIVGWHPLQGLLVTTGK